MILEVPSNPNHSIVLQFSGHPAPGRRHNSLQLVTQALATTVIFVSSMGQGAHGKSCLSLKHLRVSTRNASLFRILDKNDVMETSNYCLKHSQQKSQKTHTKGVKISLCTWRKTAATTCRISKQGISILVKVQLPRKEQAERKNNN